MKVKFIIHITIILFITSFSACEDKEENIKQQQIRDNQYVNNWIHEKMSFYYLWNDMLPAHSKLDFKQSPSTFFEALLYPYNTKTHEGDRFSWIQESYTDLINALRGVTPTDIGFEYYTVQDQQGKISFWIVYVKKGTDAENKGLKRGDIITAVDGQDITPDNYTALLRSGKTSYEIKLWDKTLPVKISVMSNYAENPVHYSSIINKGDKKIGYLVYNFFAADKGDQSHDYEKELNEKLQGFYNENINELILDLRYNGGGAVRNATYLASAIVKNRDEKDKFAYSRYNDLLNSELKKELSEKEYDNTINDHFQNKISISEGYSIPIPRLGDKINRVYILTGLYTASASELIINGLKPFMDVILIGDRTYGKNVGSISIYEDNDKRNKWGIQPIINQYYNKNGNSDYAEGFTPQQDLLINEFSEPLKPFGDTNEILLRAAIEKITGAKQAIIKNTQRQSTVTLKSSLEFRPNGQSMYISNEKIITSDINR